MKKPKLSFVHGVSEQPLIYQTIGEALSLAADQWGDNEALVSHHQAERYSYRDLDEKTDQLAASLLKLGLEPGDRIGIWAPNCAEWVLTQFASAKAGLILVNINPAYRLTELEYALNKVSCRALVLWDEFKTSNYLEMIESLAPEIISSTLGNLDSKKLPHLKYVIQAGKESRDGFYDFYDVLNIASADEVAQLAEIQARLCPDDPINIQFTGGTTGSPKGATLSHFNILNNGYFVGEAIKLSEHDRLCIPVPLYHCFGMVMGNLGSVTHGSTMVLPDFGFDPITTLQTVAAEKCTVLYGVPTMFVAELAEPSFEDYDLSTLRTGIMAGSPCPEDVMKRVISDMHMGEVTIAYGMTETSPVSFQSSTDDSVALRVSTVGKVHPHVQVKIIDEDGNTVPRGVQGELLTRGYSVMQGYWGEEEKTKDALDSAQWMHTGDLAVIDENGYGNITGRLKDMVIRGGENIYPKEIEDFLYTHPKVMEVAAFGVPDEKYGEEVCVWIKKNAGETLSEDEIKSYCDGQIAHYKKPRYVEIVEEFPMTVTGKIQKFVMRDMMQKKMPI